MQREVEQGVEGVEEEEEEVCGEDGEGVWVVQGGEGAAAQARVRVLLFRECERRGRKLLYDSR